MGNTVYCIDINQPIIDNLNNGKIHIYEPGLEPLVKRNHNEGRLQFSTKMAEGLENALLVFNGVVTPPKAIDAVNDWQFQPSRERPETIDRTSDLAETIPRSVNITVHLRLT
jgi:UDP-glucose 6-dehydrogenase